jgi:hypothetical protein
MSSPIDTEQLAKKSLTTTFNIFQAYVEKKDDLDFNTYMYVVNNLLALAIKPMSKTIRVFSELKENAGLGEDKDAIKLARALEDLMINYENGSIFRKEVESLENEMIPKIKEKNNEVNQALEESRLCLKKDLGSDYRPFLKNILPHLEDFEKLYSRVVALDCLQEKVSALWDTKRTKASRWNCNKKLEKIQKIIDNRKEVYEAYGDVISKKKNGKTVLTQKNQDKYGLSEISPLYKNLSTTITSIKPIISQVGGCLELKEELDRYLELVIQSISIGEEMTKLVKTQMAAYSRKQAAERRILGATEKIEELKKSVEYQTLLDYKLSNKNVEVNVFDIDSKKLGSIFLTPNGIVESAGPTGFGVEYLQEWSLDTHEKFYVVKSALELPYDGITSFPIEGGVIIGNPSGEGPYKINLRIPPIGTEPGSITLPIPQR